MSKGTQYSTTIAAIFRPADPVRQMLRDSAFGHGFSISLYDHLLDAVSRIPLTPCAAATLIITRPETLSAEGVAAFDMLLGRESTHYALWLEDSDTHSVLRQYPLAIRPHPIENALRLGELLDHIESHRSHAVSQACVPPQLTSCRRPDLPRQPLSSEELEALLEIGL